jgi:long-chain acyl-CoA synthetase
MENQAPKTISQAFLDARARPQTQTALRYRDGSQWVDVSWQEYFSMSEHVACGLAHHGVKRGDRVAIMSNTCYQWAVADMAILGVGAVTVPIYHLK